jgi:hypothetical protein
MTTERKHPGRLKARALKAISIPQRKQPKDWFRILRDLRKLAGISMADVASICNRNTSTVENWANGGEPKDSDARVLLALYALLCPAKYDSMMQGFALTPHDLLGHINGVRCPCWSCSVFHAVDRAAPGVSASKRVSLAFELAFDTGRYESAIAEAKLAQRQRGKGQSRTRLRQSMKSRMIDLADDIDPASDYPFDASRRAPLRPGRFS